jgi:hypothetical protein
MDAVHVNDLVRTSDNSYFSAGIYNMNGFLMNSDSGGNIITSKQFEIGNSTKFNSLTVAPDSNLAIVGVAGDGDALLMKLNKDGDTLWSRMLDFGNYSEAFSVCSVSDSGFAFCGYIYDPSNESKIFVARADKNGSLLWSKTYAGGNSANYAYSIKQSPDSGFMVAGYYSDYPPFASSAVLLKLDSNGDTMWTKGYLGLSSEVNCMTDVVCLQDGYVFCGQFSNQLGMAKVDTSGSIEWFRKYDLYLSTSLNEIHSRLKMISNNRFMIATVPEMFSYGQLMVADSNGTQLINHDIFMIMSSAIETADNGFMIAGNGPIYGVKSGNEFLINNHFSLMKTDSAANSTDCNYDRGLLTTTTTLTSVSLSSTLSDLGSFVNVHPVVSNVVLDTSAGCVTFLGGSEEMGNNSFTIFPNPSSGEFTIRFDQPQNNAECFIDIYNPLGECIYKSSFVKQNDISINLNGFQSGLYFISINTDCHRITKIIEIQ